MKAENLLVDSGVCDSTSALICGFVCVYELLRHFSLSFSKSKPTKKNNSEPFYIEALITVFLQRPEWPAHELMQLFQKLKDEKGIILFLPV